MKKTVILSLVIMFVMSTLIFAGRTAIVYESPVTAIQDNIRVDRNIKRFEADGYTLQTEIQNEIEYIIMPSENHLWGTITYTFTKVTTDPDGTQQVDYAVITVHIITLMNNGATEGYRVNRIVTEEYSTF